MIFLTGASGFIGQSIINSDDFPSVVQYRRGSNLDLNDVDIVLHLAGKSLDLKGASTESEYYESNTLLTQRVFDAFLDSSAKVFITLSSVKSVAHDIEGELVEEHTPNPVTHYGKSKLLAEEYILSKHLPSDKRFYILRPCIVHGPGNKGNLNVLYNFVRNRIPWPLGAFHNLRSYSSIDNLIFILKELIERADIPSGIYNVADDEPLSTNELIELISRLQNREAKIWNISKKIIEGVASLGDRFQFPLNTERLQKLTSSYIVSNAKIKVAIGKPFPVSSREGLLKTFRSFNNL